jgi:hypothetical protein
MTYPLAATTALSVEADERTDSHCNGNAHRIVDFPIDFCRRNRFEFRVLTWRPAKTPSPRCLAGTLGVAGEMRATPLFYQRPSAPELPRQRCVRPAMIIAKYGDENELGSHRR